MYSIDPSFVLDLIVKVVTVAEAAPAVSGLRKVCVLYIKLLDC